MTAHPENDRASLAERRPGAGCILCGATTELLRAFPRSVTSESKLLPAASALRLCASCGHLQSTVDLDLAEYYAQSYDSVLSDEGPDELVSTADGRIVFRTDVDFEIMSRHLADDLARSPSIFELGCGRGRILSRLHKAGHRKLAAFDLSELYRAPVTPFLAPGGLYIGTRPTDVSFDVAISFFMLEHDVDPVGSLLYLRERLHPAGKLFLMLPSYVTNTVDLACADHVNHFSPTTLTALVAATGFRVLTVDDTSAIGAVVVVATPDGPPVSRADLRLASPERVALGRASSAEFLDYAARLESLAAGLRADRVALYGAGFYGTLVQARLEAAGLRVTDLFDANPRKQGQTRLGLTVRSPDALAAGGFGDVDLVMCINPRIAASVGEKFASHVRAVHVV